MMARRSGRLGKISTFFSYKGGVGRTMAVANVGFIAAMAGKRVLLMDWDLEAPGLAVYFRGITDHEAAGNIRKSPGVLDLFVNWRDALLGAQKPQDVADVFKRFNSGAPFSACACPLLPADRLPKGAKLDIINAGSAVVGLDDPLPYADALSRFHWPNFFSEFAGGAMLEALRTWARRNYDMILIDSRTGLADVAGICTMQLPDEVVLCFVLNRQNTEGVADIAASIRAARGNEVAIRLSPMRVSKDRPTEEADARARAQREMRNAGLETLQIEEDMARLSIAAAPNIPFYEALAPFVASSATADPLTFEYLRLTQTLAGEAFEAPRVEPAWIEAVRRRLQPRMTTIDYLGSLENADPDRAFEELDRFLDGALDADPNRELDADYVDALVDAAFRAPEWLWSEEKDYPVDTLAAKAILLLRQLHSVGGGDWRIQLVDALDEFDLRWRPVTPKTVIKGNVERDAILAAGAQSPVILIRRAQLKVTNARNRAADAGYDKINLELVAAEYLLEQINGPVQPEISAQARMGRADIALLRAEAFTREPGLGSAEDQWRQVLSHLQKLESARAANLAARAHLGLSEIVDGTEAVDHILAAAKIWPPSVTRDKAAFDRACAAVLQSPDSATQSIAFVLAAFARPRTSRFPFGPSMHRTVPPVDFAQQLEALALAMGPDRGRRKDALALVAEAAEQQLQRVGRVGSQAGDLRAAAKVVVTYLALTETLDSIGVPEEPLASLRQRLEQLRRRIARPAS